MLGACLGFDGQGESVSNQKVIRGITVGVCRHLSLTLVAGRVTEGFSVCVRFRPFPEALPHFPDVVVSGKQTS